MVVLIESTKVDNVTSCLMIQRIPKFAGDKE